MAEYASLTVAQLKELLKTKGLALDGKKADLVQRLQEADGPGELDDEPETKPAEPEPTKEEAVAEPVVEDAPEAAAPVAEKPKKLTPEERKKMAVDLLTKKINRAVKFGDEALAQAARKDLARVEKFGLDPSTALAKELGVVNRSFNSELRTEKIHKNKSKKTGKKGKTAKA